MGLCASEIVTAEAGRRKDRQRAILDAAEELFLEQGFAKASLGAIVRRSGGSLATVYEMFGNKEGLLRAVVDRRREEWLRDLVDLPWDQEEPRAVLLRFAQRCFDFVSAPRSIALLRIVIAQSLEDPDFGWEFHRDTNRRILVQLAAIFRRWTENGQAHIDDAEAAVELFFAMVMCEAPLKTMLGVMAEENHCRDLEWRLAPFFSYFRID